MTAGLVKFSLAINSIFSCWRSVSARITCAISASTECSCLAAESASGSILFTRRSWRPPSSNLVSMNVSRMLLAKASSVAAAPRQRTFALLCWRVSGRFARHVRARPLCRAPCWRSCSCRCRCYRSAGQVGSSRRPQFGPPHGRSLGSRLCPPSCTEVGIRDAFFP
ncbi:MAG: hypothetical protein CM1200mP29_11320 [Verrucomicrobiota bacterium]|nr:MAG: hypothetical protein CM1200mP29_11320 [Verrucomicrobiota bacterium]